MRKYILIALGCWMVVYYAVDATAKSTVKGTAKPIDIEAVQDSVLVMADEYAEALASKPEMAPTRMNLLKKFLQTPAPRSTGFHKIFNLQRLHHLHRAVETQCWADYNQQQYNSPN